MSFGWQEKYGKYNYTAMPTDHPVHQLIYDFKDYYAIDIGKNADGFFAGVYSKITHGTIGTFYSDTINELEYHIYIELKTKYIPDALDYVYQKLILRKL